MTSHYVGQLLNYLEQHSTDKATMIKYEFAFFRLVEHDRPPRFLNAAMASEPEIFVELANRVYRSKTPQSHEAGMTDSAQATQALWVLHQWTGFPGKHESGGVDERVLVDWVRDARLRFSETDRSDIGDELIGHALARAPADDDRIWPAKPIRELIETIGSRELENGLVLGRLNSRGMTTRDPYDGGTLERALEVDYRDWSNACRTAWPRTARALLSIAEHYEHDARLEDVRAAVVGDTS